MRGLRGHDGAVHAISFDHAMVAHAAAGMLHLGTFERRPVILWTPPPTVPRSSGAFWAWPKKIAAIVRDLLTAQGL